MFKIMKILKQNFPVNPRRKFLWFFEEILGEIAEGIPGGISKDFFRRLSEKLSEEFLKKSLVFVKKNGGVSKAIHAKF